MAGNKLSFHEDDVVGFLDGYGSNSSDSDSEHIISLEESNNSDYKILSSNYLLTSQNERKLLLASNSHPQSQFDSESPTVTENESPCTVTQSLNASDSVASTPPVLAQVCKNKNYIAHCIQTDRDPDGFEGHDDEHNYSHNDELINFICSCTKSCMSLFNLNDLIATYFDCKELTVKELDLVLTAKLQALISCDSTIIATKKISKERIKSHTFYMHYGKSVCKQFFLKLHNIGHHRLDNLVAHLKQNGLSIRQKRSGGRKNNTRSINFHSTKNVVSFLSNFTEEHGIKLPGRVPGFKTYDISLLPSEMTKYYVYSQYVSVCSSKSGTIVGFTTFRSIWSSLLPFIILSKPATDLCWVCQLNNALINK